MFPQFSRLRRWDRLGWGLIGLSLAGCQSAQTSRDYAAASSMVTVAAPALAVGATYSSFHGSAQTSSLVLGLPESTYAQAVTADELGAIAARYGWKFHEPWAYAGTKDGRHHLALHPAFSTRRIYTIAAEEWPMDDPFPLTAFASGWRPIDVLPRWWVQDGSGQVNFNVPLREVELTP